MEMTGIFYDSFSSIGGIMANYSHFTEGMMDIMSRVASLTDEDWTEFSFRTVQLGPLYHYDEFRDYDFNSLIRRGDEDYRGIVWNIETDSTIQWIQKHHNSDESLEEKHDELIPEENYRKMNWHDDVIEFVLEKDKRQLAKKIMTSKTLLPR
jgi:hypothetical protein